MSKKSDTQRYKSHRQVDISSAAKYRASAETEDKAHPAKVYLQLAAIESIESTGGSADGTQKQDQGNGAAPRSTGLPRHRSSPQGAPHFRWLRVITNVLHGGIEGAELVDVEARHRPMGGNALRASVLGANDGLVSNLSLVMGVAGAELTNSAILITGVAGLLAGAISMALGEWLSVQSSRELYKKQIAIAARDLENAPEEEERALAGIYQAKGLPEPQARELASHLMTNRESALDTLVREELGVDPKELGGSAWEAAGMSFVLFAIGAVVPVAPFAFLSGWTAVIVSLVGSAVALFIIGAGITLMTGRSVLFSGTRQVIFGLVAAVITFAIGRLIGVNVAG